MIRRATVNLRKTCVGNIEFLDAAAGFGGHVAGLGPAV